jgi:hypothetical protein
MIMSATIYASQTENSLVLPLPLTICPKCGRLVKIDGHCECEAIFFSPLNQDNEKENAIFLLIMMVQKEVTNLNCFMN